MRRSSIWCVFLGVLLITSQTSIATAEIPNREKEDPVLVVAGRFHKNFNSVHGGIEPWMRPLNAELFTRDPITLQWIPNLASQDLVMLANGSFQVMLREELQFSNGNSLTASDVVLSYQTYTDPDVWVGLADLEPVFDVDSFAVIDELTIQFNPTEKVYNPHEYLNLPIIDEQFYGPLYENCKENPIRDNCDWYSTEGFEYLVGAGPYELVAQKKVDNNLIYLYYDKNPYFWNSTPTMAEELVFMGGFEEQEQFQLYQEGEIDILLSSIAGIQEVDLSGNRVIADSTTVKTLWPNHFHPYIGSGKAVPGLEDASSDQQLHAASLIRKALAHMVDPESLDFVNSNAWTHTSYPTNSIIGRGSRGWDSNLPVREYNITKAKQYLTQAGFDYDTLEYNENSGSYESYFFDLTCVDGNNGGSQFYDNYQWTLLEGLRQIGINGSVEMISLHEWVNRVFMATQNPALHEVGGFDCVILSLGQSFEYNPEMMFHEAGLQENWGEGYPNFINYVNHTVEELIDEYLASAPLNDVAEEITAIQKALYDDLPAIPLFGSQFVAYYRDDITIAGPEFVIYDRFLNYDQISSPSWKYSNTTNDRLGFFTMSLALIPVTILRRRYDH